MDYSIYNDTIIDRIMRLIKQINNIEIDPEIRQLNQEILFREIGQTIYSKVYDMNAFDYEIDYSQGQGIDDRYYGLAKIVSGSVSTGSLGIREYVRNFLDHSANKAQEDATTLANSSGKRTVVIRTMNGETCKWCESLAGRYENPDSEVFKRHGGCDCRIVTQGFRSRNGELKNYAKKTKA